MGMCVRVVKRLSNGWFDAGVYLELDLELDFNLDYVGLL